jgi:uncharacterized membrane protein
VSDRTNALAGRLGRLALILTTVLAISAAVAPAALADNGLEVTTPYPSVSVAPGSDVSFDLDVTSNVARQVELSVSGVPSGWSASLLGGGFVVNGVSAGPGQEPDVRLDVDIPAEATSGTTRMTIVATAPGASDRLPIAITVNTEAAGAVTMTPDFASLQGPSSTTFTFNLSLDNDTAQDLTFGLNAQGPAGWTVSATPSSQSQASSLEVTAGSSQDVKVTANPPTDVPAGDYPIVATASAGDITTSVDLMVTVTGQYELTLTTPDGRLNGSGSAGSASELTLTLVNDGTAPLVEVTPTTTAPSGWEITFEPETVATLEPGVPANVVARITPSSAAVAGDYEVTMRASGKSVDGQQTSNADVVIRFTVETSPLFLVVGVGLIVLVFAGLALVFQRYGRR